MKFTPASFIVLIGCVLIANRCVIAVPPSTTIPTVTGKKALAFIFSLRDSRQVRDAVNLHLEDITPAQSWMIGKVKPDRESFRGRVVGGHFDFTGRWVQDPGVITHTIVREYGTIEPISIISGTTTAPHSYQWEYDEALIEDSDDWEEGKSPLFRRGRGGTAIFRIDANAEGQGKLRPAYLVNEEWVSFLEPALKFVQDNKEVFDSDAVSEHREQLQELLTNTNPFLGIAAARTLSDAHQLKSEFVQTTLSQTNGLEQSVFMFLALKQLPVAKHLNLDGKVTTQQSMTDALSQAVMEETLVIDLAKVIDSAKNAETLKAATIALTASLEAPQSQVGMFTVGRATELLHHVIARKRVLGTHTDADIYLEEHPAIAQMMASDQKATPIKH